MTTSDSPLPNARVLLTSAMAPCIFLAGTSSRMIDRPSGKIAVAEPWSARATISRVSEVVLAASTEPATITTSTAIRVRFLPYWSPTRPSSGVKTAADSRVAVVTQLTPAELAWRSEPSSARIGMTWVCAMETTMAASPRARISGVLLRRACADVSDGSWAMAVMGSFGASTFHGLDALCSQAIRSTLEAKVYVVKLKGSAREAIWVPSWSAPGGTRAPQGLSPRRRRRRTGGGGPAG